MKTIIKAAAIVALAWSMVPVAEAQTAFPGTTSATGTALIVTIWDPNAGVSLVYALPGLTYQSARSGGLTPQSWSVPDFADIFGTDLSSVLYQVSALGLTGVNEVTGMIVTGPASIPAVVNTNVSGTFTNATTFHSALNTDCGTDPVCAASSSDGSYGGLVIWGDLGAQLPFSAAANVGTALSFWDISQQDLSRIRASDPAVSDPVEGGFAQWLLSEDGTLSYSVVPLPAAVWLLLSGLVGFGAISRRRRAETSA